MICLIGNKKERLNPSYMKYSEEISLHPGTTSDVYLIKGKAYKLYRLPYSYEPISKSLIVKMQNISTKRIILPEEPILNKKHHLIGTISPYIKDLGIDNLLALNRHQFITEINNLIEDSITLGSKKIIINDLFINNFVFNNGMYFIDIGKFYETNKNENIAISDNLDRLNEFLIERFLIPLVSKYSTDKSKSINQLKKDFYTELRNNSIMEILKKDFSEENVKEYLKKRAGIK